MSGLPGHTICKRGGNHPLSDKEQRILFVAGTDGDGRSYCSHSLQRFEAGPSAPSDTGRSGLGYLTLGEETPGLSGGEAQRLKLASEMGRAQSDSVFIFDEPTIGLHPLDVNTLMDVFQTLIDHGATVVVIEHDLDVIRCADYIIDMGPGGGKDGGTVVAAGTPENVKTNPDSRTGAFL